MIFTGDHTSKRTARRLFVRPSRIAGLRHATVTLAAAVALAASLAPVSDAHAQQQEKSAVKCFLKLTKSGSLITKTILKEAKKCAADAANDKLDPGEDASSCLTGDSRGMLDKVSIKLAETAAKSCGTENLPDFGLADSVTVEEARVDTALGLIADGWGADFGAAILDATDFDPKGKCGTTLLDGIRKAFNKADKTFTKCATKGMKDKGDPIISSAGISDCLDQVKADPKQLLAKEFEKLKIKLLKKCPGVTDFTTVFPGLAQICGLYGETAVGLDSLIDCQRPRLDCRICRQAETANEISADCSLFDDGIDAGPLGSSCPECGNGIVDLGEDCDDGNTDDGDCCSSTCLFEPAAQVCVGPSSQCTASTCDGLGTCSEGPANEGGDCDDNDICTSQSECQIGSCVATQSLLTGNACTWAVVGSAAANTELETRFSADISGPICGEWADFGEANTMTFGDIVLTGADGSSGNAAFFSTGTTADDADIISNNAPFKGRANAKLPGLDVDLVAAGSVVNKTPAPTFYDTTGTDPRLQGCNAAQSSLDTARLMIESLPSHQDLGDTWKSIPQLESRTVIASMVGGVNVIDVNEISSEADVTLTFDGGGNADTVFIIRSAGRINTGVRNLWDLTNGTSAENLLIFSGSTASTVGSGCEIGSENIGAGTLLCPDTKIWLRSQAVWNGAVFGGAGGIDGSLILGNNVALTQTIFTGM